MRVKMSKQPQPAPTASAVGPCPTVIKIVGRPGTGSLPSTFAPPDHPLSYVCVAYLNDNSFLYFLHYLPFMVKATMSFILNTVKNIFMTLYGSVEEIMALCLVKYGGSSVHILPHPPTTQFSFLDLDSVSKFTY